MSHAKLLKCIGNVQYECTPVIHYVFHPCGPLSLQRVLDVESHPIVGRLVGKQHLVLISNGKKLYNLHSLPSAETHLSLNGMHTY